jgi:hypothetical protein
MHLKGTFMGNKVILITLVILIATAGFLLIQSDSPITIAGETLGTEPIQPRSLDSLKESSPQASQSTSNQK